MPRTRLRLAALLCLGAGLAPAARADLATTNLQVLQGWYFYDPTVGSDMVGGEMNTVTLNHFSTWKHGDNFAFVDLMQGDARDGTKSHLYGELHPRLFLNRVLGTKGNVLGIFKDAGIAAELDLGHGFQAWLAGLGGDLAVKFGVVGIAVYYRYTELQLPGVGPIQYDHTWQVSPYWTIPFEVGHVPFLFTGFVDVDGVKEADGSRGYEVMAQPQLLVDALALAGGPKDRILVGIEWYLHYHSGNERLGAPGNLVSAPQATIQWTLH
ncbi:MAG TPA: ion channel protein Tsx [Anaeromyxobacter sp.]|nr:ion channel protein Tsx [Anaeromyxobacter sp.]